MTTEVDVDPPPADAPKKILLVDDHPFVRAGMAMLIAQQPDMVVCGQAAGIEDAFQLVEQLSPALAVIDLILKDGHGLPLTERIRRFHPATKVLVHSMYDDTLYAERVKQAGASGYLNKQAAPERLVSSIREIFSGGIAFEPGLTNRLTRRSCTAAGNPRSIGSLTDRELQVFELIGQGLTTRRIANRLKLSTHTIDTHREKIKAKLQLTSGVELMRHAVRWLLEQQWERCDDSGGGSRARVVIEDQLMQRAAATCPPGV